MINDLILSILRANAQTTVLKHLRQINRRWNKLALQVAGEQTYVARTRNAFTYLIDELVHPGLMTYLQYTTEDPNEERLLLVNELIEWYDPGYKKDMIAAVHNYIMSRCGVNPPRFGDFIFIPSVGEYRNDGIFIWNGIEIIPLDNRIDEYGALPRQFLVLGTPYGWRPLRYYLDASRINIYQTFHEVRSMEHNNLCWIDAHLYIDQINGWTGDGDMIIIARDVKLKITIVENDRVGHMSDIRTALLKHRYMAFDGEYGMEVNMNGFYEIFLYDYWNVD
jgi:hypothetical protein